MTVFDTITIRAMPRTIDGPPGDPKVHAIGYDGRKDRDFPSQLVKTMCGRQFMAFRDRPARFGEKADTCDTCDKSVAAHNRREKGQA